jgi:hypothetical protein
MQPVPQNPLRIGWKEHVALPEWNVGRLRAKIDTGARTSALDAAGYELHEVPGGTVVRLRLRLSRKHPERQVVVEAPVLKMAAVRNSSGMRELRPVIETTVCLGPLRKRIRLTVTNRAGMIFRMILGREALAGDFLVDVGKKYLLRNVSGHEV